MKALKRNRGLIAVCAYCAAMLISAGYVGAEVLGTVANGISDILSNVTIVVQM